MIARVTNVTIKDGRYYLIRTLQTRSPKTGRFKQQWHGLTRVDEGEAALHAALSKALAEPKPTTKVGNLPGLVTDYLKTKIPELRSEYVKAEYRRMYATIADQFEEFNAEDVRAADVLSFLSDYAGKARTKQAYKSRLSSFFGWCVLTGKIEVNPCAEIRVKRPASRGARLDAEKFHRWRDALHPLGQCMLDLLFLTAQRPHDIRLLRMSQIEEAGIRFLPSKTEHTSGKEVLVPMTPQIAAVLAKAKELQGNERRIGNAFLFQTAGSAYSKSGWTSLFRKARDKAKLPKGIASTDVRPFALAEAKRAGYAVDEIKTAAAHSDIATTGIYLQKYETTDSVVRLVLPKRPGA